MEESERRKDLRVYSMNPTMIKTASGHQIKAKTIDVSLHGFKFCTEMPLELQDRVTASVMFPNGRNYRIEGIIRHVTQKDMYHYGVAFTPETVEILVKDFFA